VTLEATFNEDGPNLVFEEVVARSHHFVVRADGWID